MQAADGCFRSSMLDRLSTASPPIRGPIYGPNEDRLTIGMSTACRQYSALSVISAIALSCHARFPDS